MKIIEDNLVVTPLSIWRVTCYHCDSVLEYDRDDIFERLEDDHLGHEFNVPYVKCAVCARTFRHYSDTKPYVAKKDEKISLPIYSPGTK